MRRLHLRGRRGSRQVRARVAMGRHPSWRGSGWRRRSG